MRKDKILLILGFILTIIGIGLIVVFRDTSSVYLVNGNVMIFTCGIILLFRGFITKRRLDSGLVQVDERIIKIAYKSIIFSWNITFILVGLLLFLNGLEFSITSFQSTGIIFCTMAASYILGTCYYENKKL